MTDITKKVYMIRRKSDGLFSTGGTTPSFNKRGKAWSNLGALKNHLNQAITYDTGYRYRNDGRKEVSVNRHFKQYLECEVICFEYVQTNTSQDTVNISEFFDSKIALEGKKAARWDRDVMMHFTDGTKKLASVNANDN